MKHIGNRTSVILLISLILIFSGLSVNAASQPKYGGMLNVGINTDVLSVDPHNNPADINAYVLSHIFDRMVTLGENMEILPCLAERWDISSDYKTYTFYLRKGKLFHNGRELEAEDVKYSFERILDPKTGCPKRGEFRIKSIEVVDKYTVRFHMTQSDATLLIVMAQVSPVIAVVPREEIEKQGGFFKHPIGTGPYKFVEWKPDRYLLVERFEQYKPDPEPVNGMAGQKIAYLDKIKFIPVPEESVATMAMLNKEIEFLHFVPWKDVQLFQEKRGIEVVQIPGLSFYDIVFGCDKPITKDVRFRKACAYAVDRAMVTKAATKGHAVVNPSMVPMKSAYRTAHHDKWYEKDVNKAKELLKASGYKGEEIPLLTTKKYAMMYDQSLAVQSELRAVGINVKLVVQDWGIHLKKFFDGEYQMISWGHGSKPDPMITYGLIKSSNFHKQYPKIEEELLPKLAATMDFETRKKIFEECHSQMIEGVPLIGLFNYNATSAYWVYVKGFKQLCTNQPRFWNVWLDK